MYGLLYIDARAAHSHLARLSTFDGPLRTFIKRGDAERWAKKYAHRVLGVTYAVVPLPAVFAPAPA